jgi:tetratricopeptide (TPR) repeat protein
MKKKILFVFIIILMLFSIFEGPVNGKDQTAESEPVKTSLAEVDELMKEKTIKNCEKAIKGYELLLKDDPNNDDILYKIANAYITIIDIKTSALRVEKDEYKPILKELGKIANDYAKKAYELKPKKKEVVAACLVSYGYYSASFGIVKAIFKGAAGHYKDLCYQLIEIDKKYLGALGYRLLGKLYHVAPWPVGSSKKALKFFLQAAETDNSVLYTHYYLGLLYFKKKEYDLAEKEFKFVWENEPTAHEKHFIGDYKKDARYYLRQIAKMKQEK